MKINYEQILQLIRLDYRLTHLYLGKQGDLIGHIVWSTSMPIEKKAEQLSRFTPDSPWSVAPTQDPK